MMDNEVLYFACQYLQEAVNDSMTTENDSTVAIFYNKCLKDISTGTGKFVTDKEMLVFACQQLKKMAIKVPSQMQGCIPLSKKDMILLRELLNRTLVGMNIDRR